MSTVSTFDAFLKDHYGDKRRVQTLMYKDFPFLGWLTKNTGVSAANGRRLVAPVLYGTPQSVGTTLATTQSVATATGGSTRATDWYIPFGDYVGSVQIDDKVMSLSASDIGAYLDARKTEIDGLYNTISCVFSSYLLGTAGHALGSFTISTGVCTMVTPDDIVNIQVGMQIQASANSGDSGSDTLLGSGSIGYVIAVNQNAYTFTVSTTDGGSAGTPASWTGTMYAFRRSDFGGSGATFVCYGFGDWVPASDPSATAFCGVDRTKSIIPLSGVRIPAAELAGLSTEQRIKRLGTRMMNRGFGAPDVFWLNPEKWQDVADGLESRGIRDAIGKEGIFGYQTIKVATGGKIVDIMADRFVPYGAIYAMKKDAYSLNTPDEFPRVFNRDGFQMLRKGDTNAYEFRLVAYPATLCTPGLMGRAAAA
jgi:hypothetical protein